MGVYGLDFTSSPCPAKPIISVRCRLNGRTLHVRGFEDIVFFDGFETALQRPGPWIAGMDFPFGQSRKLVENLG